MGTGFSAIERRCGCQGNVTAAVSGFSKAKAVVNSTVESRLEQQWRCSWALPVREHRTNVSRREQWGSGNGEVSNGVCVCVCARVVWSLW